MKENFKSIAILVVLLAVGFVFYQQGTQVSSFKEELKQLESKASELDRELEQLQPKLVEYQALVEQNALSLEEQEAILEREQELRETLEAEIGDLEGKEVDLESIYPKDRLVKLERRLMALDALIGEIGSKDTRMRTSLRELEFCWSGERVQGKPGSATTDKQLIRARYRKIYENLKTLKTALKAEKRFLWRELRKLEQL